MENIQRLNTSRNYASVVSSTWPCTKLSGTVKPVNRRKSPLCPCSVPMELGGGREGGGRKQADDNWIYLLLGLFFYRCCSTSCGCMSKNFHLDDKTPLPYVEQRYWTLLSLLFYKQLFCVFVALHL